LFCNLIPWLSNGFVSYKVSVESTVPLIWVHSTQFNVMIWHRTLDCTHKFGYKGLIDIQTENYPLIHMLFRLVDSPATITIMFSTY